MQMENECTNNIPSNDAFDRQLQQLAIESKQHPSLSPQRQLALNRLVNKILQSDSLSHPQRGSWSPNLYEDLYNEALQKTLLEICQKIDSYNPNHPVNVKRLGKLVGKLECRPVLPNADVLEVPPDAWNDRIGYVAVQLNQSLKQAILLGFAPSVVHQKGIIPLDELRSLSDFPAYLSEFSQVPEPPSLQLVNLQNWLEGIVEAGWQTIDELFVTTEVSLASAFRSRTLRFRGRTKEELIEIVQTTQDEETRWQAAERLWQIDQNHPASGVRRVADLGLQLANCAVALMVAVLPKRDRSMAILLRVYPMGSQPYLPEELQLIVLDEADNVFSEVQSRKEDEYIQYKIIAAPGDTFSVRVALNEASITETFMV